MAPTSRRITTYDVRIEVRYSGENTYAEGWVEFDGKRHNLVVEASVSDRGTTYILGGETYWWSEVQWLDEWFEDIWLQAAADTGYDLDSDFNAHATNESEE